MGADGVTQRLDLRNELFARHVVEILIHVTLGWCPGLPPTDLDARAEFLPGGCPRPP